MTKVMSERLKETRAFLESLSVVQMGRLLNGTEILRATMLEHAVESEKVSNLIDSVLDQEFAQLTPEQQGCIDALAALAKTIRKKACRINPASSPNGH